MSYGEDAGKIRRHREAGALRHRHAGGSLKGASPQAGEKRHRINRCNQAIAVLDKSVLHSSEKRYKHPDSSVESSILNERMREF